jgi:hypothetical protein
MVNKNKYYLKDKTGEIINIIKMNTIDEAITFFARLKNISKEDLLKIYEVVKE